MKKLFTLLTMLIVAIGTSWAIDVTDTFSSVVYRNTDSDKTKAMGANVGISSLTLSGDATISSSSFQVASSATGGFTVTTPTGFAIKTITFKEKSSNKVSSLTCSDGGTSKITGPTSKVYTYTATTTINSVTFTWSGNGGNVLRSRLCFVPIVYGNPKIEEHMNLGITDQKRATNASAVVF